MSSESKILNLKCLCSTTADWLRKLKVNNITLLHHNDCDGLTSGTILSKVFERQHYNVHRYCLEKPYPIVIDELVKDPWLLDQGLLVLVDFGAGMLSIIDQLNTSNIPVLIIDHHKIEDYRSENIYVLNCLQADLKGDAECSASSLAYQFAVTMDKDNQDLIALGLLGALGDGQPLLGLNLELYEEALKLALITKDCHFNSPHNLSASDFINYLNALGSFAYFNQGADFAVKGLSEGFTEYYQEMANKLQVEFKTILTNFIANMEMHSTTHIDWFILPVEFEKYGVKTVGLVCEELLKENKVKEDRYLAGFQKVKPQVPGLGPISINQSKISMRLGSKKYEEYKKGQAKGINSILPEAIKKLNGFVDACHPHAGAGTIDPDKTEALILEINKLI